MDIYVIYEHIHDIMVDEYHYHERKSLQTSQNILETLTGLDVKKETIGETLIVKISRSIIPRLQASSNAKAMIDLVTIIPRFTPNAKILKNVQRSTAKGYLAG